jgi:cell division protein FtsN
MKHNPQYRISGAQRNRAPEPPKLKLRTILVWLLVGCSPLLLVWGWQNYFKNKTITPTLVTATAPESAQPPKIETEKTKFDFYKVLPEQEVLPEYQKQNINGAVETTPNTAATPKLSNIDSAFFLQVGSFKSEEEANKLRSHVLAFGQTVKVMKSSSTDPAPWFRVLVGPYLDKAKTLDAQRNLQQHNISGVVISPQK